MSRNLFDEQMLQMRLGDDYKIETSLSEHQRRFE